MTNTSHGHHVPGTPSEHFDGVVADGCGGLDSCDSCIQESAKIYYDSINSTKELIADLPLNTKIYVECELQVQHEKRMYTIGRALVDMEALKKIKVEATDNHELGLVIASRFLFEPKE